VLLLLSDEYVALVLCGLVLCGLTCSKWLLLLSPYFLSAVLGRVGWWVLDVCRDYTECKDELSGRLMCLINDLFRLCYSTSICSNTCLQATGLTFLSTLCFLRRNVLSLSVLVFVTRMEWLEVAMAMSTMTFLRGGGCLETLAVEGSSCVLRR